MSEFKYADPKLIQDRGRELTPVAPHWNLRSPVVGPIFIVLLFFAFITAVATATGIASFRDVGYPDSATLLRLREFIHSGHLYPDINRPPYLVTLYGPLTYGLLALPFRLAEAMGAPPQVFVRLAIVGAFIFCISLVFLISRKLYGSRSTAWLCALFAASVLPLALWSSQIRCDFVGLAFSLLSVYCFVVSIDSPPVTRSAVFAGIAFLVKATFIAAPISLVGWLLYRRQFKHAIYWSTCFALIVATGYAITWWREPLMLQHLAALRHPIFEYKGALRPLAHALAQPVVPVAAIGAFLIPAKRSQEKSLFLAFSLVSWLVAMNTLLQAGGNVNYFWQCLFASAVFAGPGLWELQRRANLAPRRLKASLVIIILASSLLLLWVKRDYAELCYTRLESYQLEKAKWDVFKKAFAGKRLLSTLSDVTAQSAIPEIPDPFLNSFLELGGQWSSAPVADEIREGVYDYVVIIPGEDKTHSDRYRGVAYWNERMWGALAATYQRTCIYDSEEEIWVRRRGSADVVARLRKMGCLGLKTKDEAPAALLNRGQ